MTRIQLRDPGSKPMHQFWQVDDVCVSLCVMSAVDLGESSCTFSVSVCASKTVMHLLAIQVQRYCGFWFLCKSCPNCHAHLSLASRMYNVRTDTMRNGIVCTLI